MNKFSYFIKNKELKIKYTNKNKDFVKIKSKKYFNKYLWFHINDLENLLKNNEFKNEIYIKQKKVKRNIKQDYFYASIENDKLRIKTNNKGLWSNIFIDKEKLTNIINNIKILKQYAI